MAQQPRLKVYGRFNMISIISVINNRPHGRSIAPGDDITNEPKAVKTTCLKAWTDEVKEAYQAHLESAL